MIILSDMSDSTLPPDGAPRNGSNTEYDYLIKFLALGTCFLTLLTINFVVVYVAGDDYTTSIMITLSGLS